MVFHEAATNFPDYTPDEHSSATPQGDICQTLKTKILCFVENIESILSNPILCYEPSFLDKFSSDLIILEKLAKCDGSCEEHIIESAAIVQNLLSSPLFLIGTSKPTTTSKVIHDYQESKPEHADTLSKVLDAYVRHPEESVSIINHLKILAFDLL